METRACCRNASRGSSPTPSAPIISKWSTRAANHNVPDGSETHFKVVIVAAAFEGERLIARHRRVNAALAEELAGGVHALALHTYTASEWRSRFGSAPMSPPCLGGDGSLAAQPA